MPLEPHIIITTKMNPISQEAIHKEREISALPQFSN